MTESEVSEFASTIHKRRSLRLFSYINIIFFMIFSTLLLLAVVFDQEYNNDMIPYTALTVGGADADDLYRETWATLRAHVPASRFNDFRTPESGPDVLNTPENLTSILPLFAVKAGYVMLLRLLSNFTDPVTAMQVVSASGALIGAFLVFLAFYRIGGVLAICWLPILGALDVDRLARIGTPDALNFALYAVSFTLLMHQRSGGAVGVLIIATFVRPDSLILNVMLAVPIFLIASRRHAILLIVGSLVVYLFTTQMSDHPGWWAHFYYTFIEKQAELINSTPPFDLVLYTKTIAMNLAFLFVGGHWSLPAILFIIIIYLGRRPDRGKLFYYICFAAISAILVKMAIFPYPLPRTSEPAIVALAFSAAVLLRAAAARNGAVSGD